MTTTIELESHPGRPILVDFHYTAPHRAMRVGSPHGWEQDDAAEAEVYSMIFMDDSENAMPLYDANEDFIVSACIEAAEDCEP
jgi:hypothetical protein